MKEFCKSVNIWQKLWARAALAEVCAIRVLLLCFYSSLLYNEDISQDALRFCHSVIKSGLQYCPYAAIFTDSLSTIDNLASSRSRSRPNLLSDMIGLLHSINSQITVVWILSHISITGNERADQLANMGCKSLRQHIDIHVGLELHKLYDRVATYINQLWQQAGNNETTGRHFYNVQPDVASRDRILFETRSAKVLVHRLRLGKCRLNSYLHKIALHDTGTCDSCEEAETIEHYLINCS